MFSLNTYWQTLKLFQNISFFAFPFPVLSQSRCGDSVVTSDSCQGGISTSQQQMEEPCQSLMISAKSWRASISRSWSPSKVTQTKRNQEYLLEWQLAVRWRQSLTATTKSKLSIKSSPYLTIKIRSSFLLSHYQRVKRGLIKLC